MDTHFICLANSYKRGGRCVAGVEIDIDANDCWTVKRKADGNPIWIRPISKDTEFGEIPEGEAHNVPLMSVVRLTDVVACPSESHTEDVNYGSMHAIGKVPSCHEVLRELTDNVHTTLFYSTEFSISIETYVQGDYSLMMVHPEGFSFRLDPTKNRAKYYMIFRYNGVTYDFSITDPAFYQYINQYPDALDKLSDVYLALSLGLEYEQRHHKLIAAVLIPKTGTAIKDSFVIRRDTLHEKAVRLFTSSERRKYRNCFIVPSQQGFAACMKMKNGQEEFMTIDDGCQVEAWQKVNLRKAQMVIYEDADGNEVKRMRIPDTMLSCSFSSILLDLWKLFHMRRMIDYVKDNPRRLWIKSHNPELFRLHRQTEAAGLSFTSMGNHFLLDWPDKQEVEMSRSNTNEEVQERLRMVLASAHNGTVTYTAAISKGEQLIARTLRELGYPLVVLLNNGFPKEGSPHERYYKPGGVYFEACSKGQLLLLEPTEQAFLDAGIQAAVEETLRSKAEARHYAYTPIPMTSQRYRFVALNEMAKRLAQNLD